MPEVGEDHGLRVAGEDHDGAMAGRGHGDVDRPWADPRYLESVCASLDGRRLKSASAGGEPDIVRGSSQGCRIWRSPPPSSGSA